MRKFAAVIFDLDGTVLENEDVYGNAFSAVFSKHNVPLIDGKFPHTPGIGMEENWKLLKVRYPDFFEISLVQLVHETQNEYHDRIKDVVVRAGFYDLHTILQEEGILIALATSNNWWLVEDELDDLDIHRYFETITTGEEVDARKPQPDIFILAARKIHVEPEDCIVIEDSQAGLEAARAAGMKVVMIRNEHNGDVDFSKADLVVEGFYDLNLKVLEGLF